MGVLQQHFLEQIQDVHVREALKKIDRFMDAQVLLRGQWKFFEIEIPAAFTNFKFQHRLGFLPKDVLQTSVIGPGTVTFNYALFDTTFLDITTTGAATVRAFVGSFTEGSVVVNN